MLRSLTSASAADKLNFSPIFFPAIGLFVSVFEFLTVTVVNALISRNFPHKFLVTNATLFIAAMFRTNMRLLQTNIRALLLRSVESWVGIQITMGYVSIADRRTLVSIWLHNRNWSQTIADDRRRSQKIEHAAIVCDRLRSRSQDRRRSQKCVSIWSQTIAELFAICDPRSAIVCDHMETSLKLRSHVIKARSEVNELRRKNRCVPYEPSYNSDLIVS